jgi:hypothetical protein
VNAFIILAPLMIVAFGFGKAQMRSTIGAEARISHATPLRDRKH